MQSNSGTQRKTALPKNVVCRYVFVVMLLFDVYFDGQHKAKKMFWGAWETPGSLCLKNRQGGWRRKKELKLREDHYVCMVIEYSQRSGFYVTGGWPGPSVKP